jgi:RNA polymerase sigma factor (sigma-70 family)
VTDRDTDIGGPFRVFPATECSIVRAAASPDPQVRKQAFDALIAAYWKPVYKYIRLKTPASNEDAKDLTQAFFARALEKGFLERYDASKSRFRTFLRVCVDGFVANEMKSATRLKRGGGMRILSLDFEGADGELQEQAVSPNTDPENLFHQEWVRSLFSLAVEELRSRCDTMGRSVHFRLFERHDLEGAEASVKVTYADLGQEFGLSVTQVTNYLAVVRRQFRELVLERLRATTGSEAEFQAEANQLLGGGHW